MAQTPKMVRRSIVIAFAILCIVTLIGLNFSIITYFSAMKSKNEQIDKLNSQIDNAQTQITNITLPTASLISVGMNYTDDRTNADAPFLSVIGYVVNVGTGPATNCSLHVSAIQNGNGTAIDKSIALDPIEAGTYQKIDIQITYSGSSIVAFTPNLEWTP